MVFCVVLKETQCRVNASTGFHAHLDMRNRNKELSFHNLVSAQSILYAMNPKSRAEGSFSRKTSSKDFSEVSRRGQRYLGVNPCSYSRHRTIEVRLHSGTIDSTKICNWLEILINIANKPDKVLRATAKVDTFCKQYGLNDTIKTYINERINKFGSVDNIPQEEAA